MLGIQHYEAFLTAGILLNLTPGNDTIFILSRSMAQGKKAGIVSALGIAAGSVVHTLMATLGLSVLILNSIWAFNLLKYTGAVYLMYIGYKMLASRTPLVTEFTTKDNMGHYRTIFRDAMVTNLLNPKVGMFFIAFLPQFVDPAAAQPALAFLLLGISFITTGLSWCLILAVFAASISSHLKSNKTTATLLNRICGLALVALGIKVALTRGK